MLTRAPKLPMTGIAHPLWTKPLCFFDTETTGLYPGRHEVIEACFLVTSSVYEVVRNGWSYDLKRELHTLIRPTWKLEPLEHCTDALSHRVNGFCDRLDELEQAPTIADVADDIRSILRMGVPVGQNPRFDIHMLDGTMRMNGLKGLHARCVDTASLAFLLLPGINSISLSGFYPAIFGEAVPNHHGAKPDAQGTLDAFFGMLERYLVMTGQIDTIMEHFGELPKDNDGDEA